MSVTTDSSEDTNTWGDRSDDSFCHSDEDELTGTWGSSGSNAFVLRTVLPDVWCVRVHERAAREDVLHDPATYHAPCQEAAQHVAAPPVPKRARPQAWFRTSTRAGGRPVERENSSDRKARVVSRPEESGTAATAAGSVMQPSCANERAEAAAVLVMMPGTVRGRGTTGDASWKPVEKLDTMADAAPTDLSCVWENDHVQAQLAEVQLLQPWSVSRGKAAALEGSPFADHVLRSVRLHGCVVAPVSFARVMSGSQTGLCVTCAVVCCAHRFIQVKKCSQGCS